MRKKSFFPLLGLLIVTSLLLSSCNLTINTDDDLDTEAIVQTSVAQTQAAMDVGGDQDDEVVEPTVTEAATPTVTMTATETQIPTETQTPTLAAPQVQVDVDTNCRTGPGEPYDIRGGLLVGEQAEVVGQYRGGDYWVIENPDGADECWVWGYYATVEGPLGDLPYYTQPPTPTPVVNWTGTWTTFIGNPGGPYETVSVTVTQSDSSATGSFTYSGDTITMSGSLSADYMTWSGTWVNDSNTGPFLWHWLNPNQFNGNESNSSNAWCGYREGAGQPSPCLYP